MAKIRFNGVWFENASKAELSRIATEAYADYIKSGRRVVRKRGESSASVNWAIRYING